MARIHPESCHGTLLHACVFLKSFCMQPAESWYTLSDCEVVFKQVKQELASSKVLAHYEVGCRCLFIDVCIVWIARQVWHSQYVHLGQSKLAQKPYSFSRDELTVYTGYLFLTSSGLWFTSQYHYVQLNIHVYLTAVSNLLFVHSGVLSLLFVHSSYLCFCMYFLPGFLSSYLGSTADR